MYSNEDEWQKKFEDIKKEILNIYKDLSSFMEEELTLDLMVQ